MTTVPLLRDTYMNMKKLDRCKCNLKYIAVYWYFDIFFTKKFIVMT